MLDGSVGSTVKMKISVDIEIESLKDNVWAAITDIEHCAEMISAIIDLKILEQPEEGLVGLKWTETRKIFGKVSAETMWITECKEGEYYSARAENHGAVYLSTMAVSESNDKTLLTMEFSGTADSPVMKMISAVMGIMMKKSMIAMLQKDLEDIKAFVEKSE